MSIADNGSQICIIGWGAGYIYTIEPGNFEQISDPNFYPARTVVYFGTYFVFDKIGTNEFSYRPQTMALFTMVFDVCERRSRKRSDYRRCD